MAVKDELGRAGEARAARHLVDEGFDVLARNWRVREGEVDIVAHDGRVVVFVEVKTRRTALFGDPLEAVDARKRARLWRLAAAWRAVHPGEAARPLRLDVVGITGDDPAHGSLTHLRDVPWV